MLIQNGVMLSKARQEICTGYFMHKIREKERRLTRADALLLTSRRKHMLFCSH